MKGTKNQLDGLFDAYEDVKYELDHTPYPKLGLAYVAEVYKRADVQHRMRDEGICLLPVDRAMALKAAKMAGINAYLKHDHIYLHRGAAGRLRYD